MLWNAAPARINSHRCDYLHKTCITQRHINNLLWSSEGFVRSHPSLRIHQAGGGGWGGMRLLLWYRANVHSSGKKAPASHTFM